MWAYRANDGARNGPFHCVQGHGERVGLWAGLGGAENLKERKPESKGLQPIVLIPVILSSLYENLLI